MTTADAEAVLARIAEADARTVDFRFTDLCGQWRHLGYAAGGVMAELLTEGVMFDGAALPGWRGVNESDMLLKPDLSSGLLDPFSAQPSLILYCDVVEPGIGFGYERDPRSTARRAEEHLARSNVADLALFAPEPEFFVFDDVRFRVSPHEAFFRVDGEEAAHNAATAYENGNTGHRPTPGRGYLAAGPRDAFADLRAEMATVLQGLGFGRVHHHHEAEAGQCEVGFDPAPLVASADRVQAFKYAVHNVAASYGKTATFMPMPLAEGCGLALHVHQSLRRADGGSVFAGTGYADLSEACLHYIGGVLHHARALNAFANPTTNSYRRLAPGLATPRLLAYAARNRSAAVRIPHAASAEGKRVEVRFPDPAANPYLALAALLMAGLDGIERRLDPGEAMDRNLYDLPPEEVEDVPTVCRTLDEALRALDADREFLTKGEVFGDDLIDAYVACKREEVEALARAPHPLEFELYYSV